MNTTLQSICDSGYVHTFRDQKALPFIRRLSDIEYLTNRIGAKAKQVESDERTLLRRLKETPVIQIPIPWEKDEDGNPRTVPFEEAIPLFRARERALYKPVSEMVPGGDEDYEEGFGKYKPLIEKAVVSQIREHREKIKKQLATIYRIEARKRELNARVREYADFAEQFHWCVNGDFSKKIIADWEEDYVKPNLLHQHACASKIQRAFRKHCDKIEGLISQLIQIQFAFHDYHDIQTHVLGLQKQYKESLNIEIAGRVMTFDDASDLYERTFKQAVQNEDMVGLAHLDVEFAPLFEKIGEIQRLSDIISDSSLELDQKYIRFQEAVEKLDAFFEQNPGMHRNPRISEQLGVLCIFKNQILANDDSVE